MSSNTIPEALGEIRVTSPLFEAGLKCLTKCFLLSRGEWGSGNAYADWARSHDESYQKEAIRRLIEGTGMAHVTGVSDATSLSSAWSRFAVSVRVHAHNLESIIPMVERMPEGQGRPSQVVPVRFVRANKLTSHYKLSVGFDAFVLSEIMGRTVDRGRIVHGDGYARTTVKTPPLMRKVRRTVGKIRTVLSCEPPPDLVLRRHCEECEFGFPPRQNAVEKDDLSLLAGMREKERKKYHSKGTFTITQLSYIFRPRRRPKRLRDKRERYHHIERF